MSCRSLLSDVYKTHNLLLLVALLWGNCHAKTSPNCVSSCGNIHNIEYPFRVKGDPRNCGRKKYELECEHDRLVLNLFSSGKYYVHAINYDNYTIRLVDVGLQQGDCSSLPLYTLSNLNFTNFDVKPFSLLVSNGSYDQISYFGRESFPADMAVALWVDCEKPVNRSPLYTDGKTSASSCIGKAASSSSSLSSGEKRRYSYFLFGTNLTVSDVADQCKIDEIVMTTLQLRLPPGEIETNISYLDFHSRLEFGFELSWLSSPCSEKCRGSFCNIGSYYSAFNCNSTFSGGDITRSSLLTGLIPPGILFLVAVVIATYFAHRSNILKDQVKVERFLENYRTLKPTRYTYAEIKKITHNLKEKLGQGGYGTVFKGKLSNDVPIAAKILDNFAGKGDDFINEVGTIGTIHHVNVVRLVGYCADGYKKALVYEYLPNDSLEKFISSDDKKASLGWAKLQDIAIGIAKGIEYLHQGCDQRILHFDIKPHNILLDKNFIPKISDFGLAKLCSKDQSAVSMTAAPRGTTGYIAPEVFSRNFGNVSHKSDVYSFGMLLLEMVGGRKKQIDFCKEEKNDEVYFPEWIYNRLNCEEVNNNEVEEGGGAMIVKKLTIVGLWCIQWYPGDRPSMKVAIQMLEGDGETLAMPPNPFSTANRSITRGKMGERPFINILEIISESN